MFHAVNASYCWWNLELCKAKLYRSFMQYSICLDMSLNVALLAEKLYLLVETTVILMMQIRCLASISMDLGTIFSKLGTGEDFKFFHLSCFEIVNLELCRSWNTITSLIIATPNDHTAMLLSCWKYNECQMTNLIEPSPELDKNISLECLTEVMKAECPRAKDWMHGAPCTDTLHEYWLYSIFCFDHYHRCQNFKIHLSFTILGVHWTNRLEKSFWVNVSN